MRMWDMSNYLTPSANDNPSRFRDWVKRSMEEMDVGLFAVQGINPPPRYPRSQTHAQCEGILEAGGKLAGYVYPFFDNGPDDIHARVSLFEPFKSEILAVALDLEDTESGTELSFDQKSDIVDAWLDQLDEWAEVLPEPQTGIYTGQGVWEGMGFPRQYTRWADRWLWWAWYGNGWTTENHPDIAQVMARVNCGGFREVPIWQYLGSASNFLGYSGFDANVINPDWLEGLVSNGVPEVSDDYWSKFGPEGNNTLANRRDWPSVAQNLEGIITSLQERTSVPDEDCESTLNAIRETLQSHGYSG